MIALDVVKTIANHVAQEEPAPLEAAGQATGAAAMHAQDEHESGLVGVAG